MATTPGEIIGQHYKNIRGIQSGTADLPRAIPDAGLPLVLVFPKAADYEEQGAGQSIRTRTWEAVVFLQKAVSGVEAQYTAYGNELRDTLVPQYFLGRPGLDTYEGDGTVLEARFLGDDGYAFRKYPFADGQDYITIAFTHETDEDVIFEYYD